MLGTRVVLIPALHSDTGRIQSGLVELIVLFDKLTRVVCIDSLQ